MCSKMQIDRHTEKDPDQTDQSEFGLLCLIRSINHTKTLDYYGKCQWPGAQWDFYLYFLLLS